MILDSFQWPEKRQESMSSLLKVSSIFGQVLLPFLRYLWGDLKAILGAILGTKWREKVSPVFASLLEACWSSLGSLLGCPGAVLRRSMFQTNHKKQRKVHIFIKGVFRYRSLLMPVLGAVCIDFAKF